MREVVVEVLPEAEAEAREAFEWYAERSLIAAEALQVEGEIATVIAIARQRRRPGYWNKR